MDCQVLEFAGLIGLRHLQGSKAFFDLKVYMLYGVESFPQHRELTILRKVEPIRARKGASVAIEAQIKIAFNSDECETMRRLPTSAFAAEAAEGAGGEAPDTSNWSCSARA